jgi:hypothetical protein
MKFTEVVVHKCYAREGNQCAPCFARANSITSIFLEWEKWQSSVRIMGYFLDGFIKRTKCLSHCVKVSFWTHPALRQAAIEPGGVLSRSPACMLLPGHARKGGTYVTLAFTQVAIVTSETISAGDKEETRHLPLREKHLHTLCWTTVTAVLLYLNKRWGEKLNQPQHWLKYIKKVCDVPFVNPFTLTAEAIWGLGNLSPGWRQIKLHSHF